VQGLGQASSQRPTLLRAFTSLSIDTTIGPTTPKILHANAAWLKAHVSGKNRDDLQAVIVLVRSDALGVALQFTNCQPT